MYKKQAEYCAVVLSKFMIFMIITITQKIYLFRESEYKNKRQNYTHVFSWEDQSLGSPSRPCYVVTIKAIQWEVVKVFQFQHAYQKLWRSLKKSKVVLKRCLYESIRHDMFEKHGTNPAKYFQSRLLVSVKIWFVARILRILLLKISQMNETVSSS